ncbi:MAG: DUF2339 domain-containing protein [Leptospiraceae bacterium]|nr:DUF2339 domain-containing protein [Leptospiraceae bacterium]
MSSVELENIKKRLSNLELELNELKELVKNLEDSKKPEPVRETKPKFALPIRETIESFLGTNLIGKSGFLAIILASIWFLSYAFENYWINESGRIFLAILGGYFLWALSFYFYKRNYQKLAPTMLGTGITIVLLGIFSAYRFYDFLTLRETFVNIFFLSMVTLFFSRISNSQALYIFGNLVVFLNPILLSTGENSYKFLFSYLTFWNLVHVWMGKTFYWRFSSLFIPVLNISLYGIWASKNLDQSSFLIPFLFLFLSFLGIFIREIYFQSRFSENFHWLSALGLLVGIIGYASLMQITTEHFYPQFTPVLVMLLALVPLALLIYPLFPIEFKKLYEISWIVVLGSAYLFLIATLSIWKQEWQNLPFVLTSSFIVTLGARQNRKIFYYIGLGLWLLSLFPLIFALSQVPTHGTFLLNTRFLIYCFAVVLLFFIYKVIPQTTDLPFTKFFYRTSVFLLIFASLVEVHHYVSDSSYRNLAYSYVLAFYSALFLAYGFMKDSLQMRKLGVSLVVLLIVKFYLYDIWSLSLIVKMISGFTLGAGLILVSMFYEKFKTKLLGGEE